MPCPKDYTPYDCQRREHCVKQVKKSNPGINPWAICTASINKTKGQRKPRDVRRETTMVKAEAKSRKKGKTRRKRSAAVAPIPLPHAEVSERMLKDELVELGRIKLQKMTKKSIISFLRDD